MELVPLESQMMLLHLHFLQFMLKCVRTTFSNNDERSGLHEAKVPAHY